MLYRKKTNFNKDNGSVVNGFLRISSAQPHNLGLFHDSLAQAHTTQFKEESDNRIIDECS